jgi:glycerol-3-phosphate acyltransferase PlsY
MSAWTAVVLLAAAYLLGSLAFSLWIGRLHGLDLRRHGSGNLGATNVYRVLGWRWGLAALFLDVGKGWLAVWMARTLGGGLAGGALPALCALIAVLGHVASPFAAFRGGKGAATGLGVFVGLAPPMALAGFGIWLGFLLLGGWVSLASGLTALAAPLLTVAFAGELGGQFPWVLGLAVLVAVLVGVRHRSNWIRLAQGTETAIWEKEPPRKGLEEAP